MGNRFESEEFMAKSKNKSAYKLNDQHEWKDVIKMQPECALISSMEKSKTLVCLVIAWLALCTAFAVFLFKMASI